MVGGAGGKDPMIAETIARDLGDDAVLELMDKILKYYKGASSIPQTRNMRLGAILKIAGKERFLRACGLA
jgi:sulfite reductase beta subunit-like hemoprotein